MWDSSDPQNWRMGREKFFSLIPIGNQMELKELMRLCFNAGGLDPMLRFDDWWAEDGDDRYKEFMTGDDPDLLGILKGLLNTLNTVIETANEKGSDFVDADAMRWGVLASEMIDKLDSGG